MCGCKRNIDDCGRCKACILFDLQDIDNVIYGIKEQLNRYSVEVIKSLHYGYECRLGDKDVSYLLGRYMEVLHRHRTTVLLGYEPCLKPREVQEALETCRILLGKDCKATWRQDLKINTISNYAEYIQSTPCVGRENWELLANQVCESIGMTVTNSKLYTDQIYFGIVNNLINCRLAYILDVASRMAECGLTYTPELVKNDCTLVLNPSVVERNCQTGYELLVSKYNCEITLENYTLLNTNCGLTYSVISQLYDCGFTINYNAATGCAELLSSGSVLSLCDIEIDLESGTCDLSLMNQTKTEIADSILIDSLCDDFDTKIEQLSNILGAEHFSSLLENTTPEAICEDCEGLTVGQCKDL